MLTLSLLCTLGPLVVFTIMGLVQGQGMEKFVLTVTGLISIGLGIVSVWRKLHLRSTIYILMIGLWVALDRLLPFIITLMICTILDELVFTPLYRRFKEDYHTNKQLDKRLINVNDKARNV